MLLYIEDDEFIILLFLNMYNNNFELNRY